MAVSEVASDICTELWLVVVTTCDLVSVFPSWMASNAVARAHVEHASAKLIKVRYKQAVSVSENTAFDGGFRR
jgi:hypothetical protein